MIALSHYNNLTPEEYLQFEEKSTIKHEYINGQIYAMAGTTDTHNIIGLNFTFIIRNHLRGSDCRVYFADVKVRLEKRNHFYYPDILVTCDDRDRETATYKSFPKLIIEVLSDSTEAFDRGDKFNDYQTLESLEEYVLVNSKHQRVETFRRGEQGLWILQTHQQESFSLQSINLTASFRDLYEDVTL
ncbi:MAG: Uma2 family endonuclease [Microcystis aeruginosa Ma_MB_S_20031200_S102]|uniref:Uma2 family endonuclease n=1 Tax=Microcystis aeruginosa Ma_MB_S_20031200_S102 TaxID=2486254 RepID=A0A552F7U9_MICAE|nr:MAG: Uma2 family endonuclease [Microcystis aeruginosa Ma_MB_S_20031200_S102D]TRU42795.1 MAG: Uma2 family endonuclease [Microcystis aeruginosa Ma_MB_S_20031200_S102]